MRKLLQTVALMGLSSAVTALLVLYLPAFTWCLLRSALSTPRLKARADAGHAELERRADALDSGNYRYGELERIHALRDRVKLDYAELEMRQTRRAR